MKANEQQARPFSSSGTIPTSVSRKREDLTSSACWLWITFSSFIYIFCFKATASHLSDRLTHENEKSFLFLLPFENVFSLVHQLFWFSSGRSAQLVTYTRQAIRFVSNKDFYKLADCYDKRGSFSLSCLLATKGTSLSLCFIHFHMFLFVS